MSNPYRQRVLQDNPDSYWPLDDTSGARVSNIQSGDYDATIWNSDFVRDVPGPDRTDIWGTRVGTRNGASVNGLPTDYDAVTVSFWYREIGPRGAWTVLTHGIDWGSQGWALRRVDHSTHVDLYIETSGGVTASGFSSSNHVLDGNWHHVAIVIDYDTGSLYVDGVHAGSGFFDPGDGFAHSSLNLVEWIETDGVQREIAEYGAWWGVALTEDQILDHYTSAFGTPAASPGRLSAPPGITASAIGIDAIEVHWDSVAEAEHYVLQRRLVAAPGLIGGPSQEPPHFTVQELVDSASPGDTVIVPAGIYRETVTIAKPLTLIGEVGMEIRGSDDWSFDAWTEMGDRYRSTLTASQNNREDVDPFPGERFPGGPDREEYCRVWVDGNKLEFVTSEPGPGQFTLDSERRVILGSGIDPASSGMIEVAARRLWIDIAAGNVSIERVTCQHAANGPFTGGIESHHQTNVTLRNSVFRYAHGLNVHITGGEWRALDNRVIDCEISYAGCMGLLASGFTELEIIGNEFHHNNAVGFHRHWHAGGAKLYAVQGVDFRGNHLYENNAVGVWFDGPCRHNRIAYNRAHNDYIGIYYEVSGDGEIHDNVVFDCTETGIYLGNSLDTVVRNNVAAWNHRGILIFVRDRSDEPYDVGPEAGIHRNVRVHDNTILFSGGAGHGNRATIAWQDSPPDWVFGPGHSGWDNRYWVEQTNSSDHPFRWKQDTYRDVAEFATTPVETSASYISRAERDAVLAAHQIR